jgi:AMP phosphorylase
MKLKVKNLNWLAGRAVAILNDKTAEKMNIFVGDRISILSKKKVYAVVDIFSRIIGKKEIGLSLELSKILKSKNGTLVDIGSSNLSDATSIIKKKIEGEELSREEILYLISEISKNNSTEAEIAYFTAAEKLNGMSKKEIVSLIKAMVKTGVRLKFKEKYVADKHCIGGIAGNRTTPLVISICAAAGLTLPKTSSRAITSAAGTADVMETITNINLSTKKIKEVIKKEGACLAWGGALGLAPSDDKIIRVERLLNLDVEPQLLASIMSKKISAGSKYILIDIPYGKDSKVESIKKAKELGKKFKEIGKYFRLKLKILYTKGSEPIGNGIGPVLEMMDVLEVLKNSPEAPKDLKEKSLYLSTELMKLCGIKNSREKAEKILSSGKAFQKFKGIVNAQNSENDFEKKANSLKLGRYKKVIKAKRSGKIFKISNQDINSLCRVLGTPDEISAGVYLHKHIGKVSKREPIITFYSESRRKLRDGVKFYKKFKPIKIK